MPACLQAKRVINTNYSSHFLQSGLSYQKCFFFKGTRQKIMEQKKRLQFAGVFHQYLIYY